MSEAILIVCPTVDGRDLSLARALDSYRQHTHRPFTWVSVPNRPTCGIAWNDGIAAAYAASQVWDWIHLTADDIEATPGWDDAAASWWHLHRQLPAPRILHTDGTLQSCGNDSTEQPDGTLTELTRVPFIPLELLPAVLPIIDTHYYTDSWVSYQARRHHGIETAVVRGYLLYHHFAQAGRLDDRLDADYQEFLARRDL